MAPPKKDAEAAVAAMQVYLGSVDRVTTRDAQKLYKKVFVVLQKIAAKTNTEWHLWWPLVEKEARTRGVRMATPGKDI